VPTIYLNDTPIEALGLSLAEGGPLLGGFSVTRATQSWQGRAGGIASPVGTVGPRVVRMVADARVASAAARLALMDALADTLTGLIEVRYEDAPDRVLRGTARVFEAAVAMAPSWVNLDPRVVVEIECPNAARVDVEPRSVVLGATPAAVPVGTLPHGGRVFLTGAAAGALSTETRLRYRGVSGVLLGELVLLPALLAGEFLTIDLDAPSLVRTTTAGVTSNVYGWKTGGAFFRPAPRDGVRSADAWGTLELTAGAGLYVYARQWST
jgi:hypothetical protein